MPTLPSDLAAALHDRYVLERVLGRGGMATVYLAQDTRHRRHVAIKVLEPELAAVLGGERFLREIETTASLRHPHILPLFDSGAVGQTGSGAAPFLYYVMPFVEGESLRDRLQRERQLPLTEALQIAREVADALAYAHSHGIVHRDIKPGNILLESGHAVVADFGIARAINVAGGERLTQTGLGIGTPEYMSPEQVAGGQDLDGRSDLYSLGCVLYEMLAGQPPFTGPTAASVVQQQMMVEAGSVTRIRPSVPPDVAAVITRSLAKIPADRWHHADEFRTQLGALEHRSGDVAVPLGVTPSRRRWAPLVGAVVVLGLLAVAGSRLIRSEPPQIEFGRRTQVTHGPGLEVHPALSPDGQLLAHIAGENSRLFVRQIDGSRPIPVAPDIPGFQGWPHWSPDGKELSFLSTRGLEIVPALGGAPRLLVPIPQAGPRGTVINGGPWSPDGREVSFVRGDTLYAVAAAGGAPRVVTTEPRLHSCAWSPDGARIACVSGNFEASTLGPWFGNIGPSAVLLIPAAGGESIGLIDDGQANTSPAWLPDGTLLFISDREGGRDIYSVRVRDDKAAAAPRRITTGLNAVTITTSADGKRIGYAEFTEISNIWFTPAPPGAPVSMDAAQQITTGSQVIEWFEISPDGRWVLFDSDRSGNADIYRMALDGAAEPERLTSDSANQFWPAYSPDGSTISFHSFRDGHRQLYLTPATGGPSRPVVVTEDDDRTASWSPDGQALYMLTDYGSPTSATRITRRNPDGTWGAPQIWRQPACMPTWSPDRRLVACAELGERIMLTSPDGDSLATLVTSGLVANMGQYPQWSSDSRTVYFTGSDSLGGYSIHSVSVSGGESRVVLRFDDPARPWHRYGFRVFGDRFWFTIGERESHVWVGEIGTEK